MEKIKGWVAWHPEKGIHDYTFYGGKLVGKTFEAALDELEADYELDAQYESECRDNMDNPRFATMAEWLHDRGWRIRPVELRFIDEEPKS